MACSKQALHAPLGMCAGAVMVNLEWSTQDEVVQVQELPAPLSCGSPHSAAQALVAAQLTPTYLVLIAELTKQPLLQLAA